ncbi:hypothetical protein ACJMK2_032972 [Sinanodonta woodiana]|uniref:Uncharacterized protein n=1 Tax=Sinanodonta woodiana TaxID=1069815 RepID=A0ABD3X4X2_SINWO
MELYPAKVQVPQGQVQGSGHPDGYTQMQMYGPPHVYGQPGQPSIVMTQSNIVYVSANTVIATSEVRPPSGMVLAILTCIFCFWPTGIGAILFANQATTEIDTNKAWRKYKMSRMFSVVSLIVGLTWISVAIWRIVYAVNYRTYYYYD